MQLRLLPGIVPIGGFLEGGMWQPVGACFTLQPMTRALLATLVASFCAACGANPKVTTATLGGTVVDGQTNQPLANALVAVYVGTVGQSATLTQAGDPNYAYGLATDTRGQFEGIVQAGTYAVRVFAKGYHCGEAAGSGAIRVALTPNAASDVAPTIGTSSFMPSQVVPTRPSVLTAALSRSSDADWLSHQVFLFEPLTRLMYSLTAPGAATDSGWPDGNWSVQIKAPSTLGPQDYTLVAASQQCVVAFATTRLTVAR